MKSLAAKIGTPFEPEVTTDLRTALAGADYVKRFSAAAGSNISGWNTKFRQNTV